jgi:hypothetical protein
MHKPEQTPLRAQTRVNSPTACGKPVPYQKSKSDLQINKIDVTKKKPEPLRSLDRLSRERRERTHAKIFQAFETTIIN